MIRRPKPGETEEELLEFQTQFLAEKAPPSASVVSRPGDKRKTGAGDTQSVQKDVVHMDGVPTTVPVTEHVPPVKKSRFKSAQERKVKAKQQATEVPRGGDIIDDNDRSTATVLTKIIERDTRQCAYSLPMPMSGGFPPVQHIQQGTKLMETQHMPADKIQSKKKSLFARQFAINPAEFGVNKAPDVVNMEVTGKAETQGMCDSGSVIDGTGLSATFGNDEAHKIHQENQARLANMSQQDLIHEQRKLMEMLDPKVLEFLKTRKEKEGKGEHSNMSSQPDLITPLTKQKTPTKIEDLEVPVTVDKDWVHMDKVEYDKLEWMKDLPPPSTGDHQTGKQARFDFKGNLLAADCDVPVNIGLHHHGDEPERAGYTLEELFQLSRSSNVQQRVLGLQTLAHVIRQAKEGNLSELIMSPILPGILDAGVVFLLRWSLDDSVPAVVIATVAALNALLVNHADEMTLDKVFHWNQGHRVVCQAPSKPESTGIKLPDVKEEKQELKDADVAKEDLVLALVERMSLLQRLKYILDVIRPPAPTVVNILEILVRVTRHSTKLAYQTLKHGGMLELIVKEYLPVTWTLKDPSQPLSCVNGIPLSVAMKLVRTLCQAGRNITAILLSNYQLEDRLLRYIIGDPKSLQLPECEAYGLQIESWNTLRVCWSYGLADYIYIELYSTIIEQLRQDNSILYKPKQEQTRVTSLVCAVEMAVCMAVSRPTVAGFKHSQDGSDMEVERSEDVAKANVNWSHVADLVQPIRILLTSLLTEIASNYQIKKPSLQLPQACLNFITTYYISGQGLPLPGVDVIKHLEDLEQIYITCMQHWNSFGFQTIRAALSMHSNLLQTKDQEKQEVSSCLPEYGSSSVNEDQFLPVAGSTTPFGFLSAVTRMVYHACKIHKSLLSKKEGTSTVPPSAILQCTDILTYLRKIAPGKPSHLASNYTTKFEYHLQYYILKLATLLYTGQSIELSHVDVTMLHSVCMNLLTGLHHGDEHLVHDLLSTVVFNNMYWKVSLEEKTASQLESLNISDAPATYLRSATQQQISFTTDQLRHDAQSHLAGIRATYLSCLGHNEKQLMASRNHFLHITMTTESCYTSTIGECLLPKDWMFLPLIELYNTFASVGSDVQNVLSSSQIGTVCDVLRWIYILEIDRTTILDRLSITLKISRIMCTFLTGNDMFLNRTVHCFLSGILRHYTKSTAFDKMDFTETIPGLTAFYDLYIGLLQQYEAVSFGDSLFGCYVLLPLQQRHSIQYRRAIWTEYTGILRTLTIPVHELLVPIQNYLEPEESNVELLRLYYQSLYSGKLRPVWCPVLYLMAVHHINRFIYTQDGNHTRLKADMVTQLLGAKNEEVKHHLIHYKMADISQKYGMQLYDSLPTIRQNFIDSFNVS